VHTFGPTVLHSTSTRYSKKTFSVIYRIPTYGPSFIREEGKAAVAFGEDTTAAPGMVAWVVRVGDRAKLMSRLISPSDATFNSKS
jgi:hypothetical protein